MSTVRQEAIRSIACAKHQLNRVDFKKTHVKDLFGVNVFNEEIQKARNRHNEYLKELGLPPLP